MKEDKTYGITVKLSKQLIILKNDDGKFITSK